MDFYCAMSPNYQSCNKRLWKDLYWTKILKNSLVYWLTYLILPEIIKKNTEKTRMKLETSKFINPCLYVYLSLKILVYNICTCHYYFYIEIVLCTLYFMLLLYVSFVNLLPTVCWAYSVFRRKSVKMKTEAQNYLLVQLMC